MLPALVDACGRASTQCFSQVPEVTTYCKSARQTARIGKLPSRKRWPKREPSSNWPLGPSQ